MAYLIDSDWLIDSLAGESAALDLLESFADDGIAISMVTYMETYEGILTSPNRYEAEARLSELLAGIPLLAFSEAVARRCAALRASLRSERRRVNSRALDLINAATALEHGLTLVTRNLEDYHDIPGLKLYP
jgi:predicted nucleic acid-binding protein